LKHILDINSLNGIKKEGIWQKNNLNFMHWLKSDILEIFRKVGTAVSCLYRRKESNHEIQKKNVVYEYLETLECNIRK
jgi:hypothetical protein